jgi:hypothetical protein
MHLLIILSSVKASLHFQEMFLSEALPSEIGKLSLIGELLYGQKILCLHRLGD